MRRLPPPTAAHVPERFSVNHVREAFMAEISLVALLDRLMEPPLCA